MFTYRKCRKEDCGIWIQMNREFMAYEIQDDALWGETDRVSDEVFENTFSEALQRPDMINLLLFEKDGVPVGFANVMTIFSIWSHGRALVLDDFFIREEYRGKGYGRKALAFIEEFAREMGCRRLQFQSEATNPAAERFYRAIGYQPAEMCFYVKYLNRTLAEDER